MKVNEVDGLDDSNPRDVAMKDVVAAMEKLPDRYRGILFVYDDEHDKATLALANYRDPAHVFKDADKIPIAVRKGEK